MSKAQQSLKKLSKQFATASPKLAKAPPMAAMALAAQPEVGQEVGDGALGPPEDGLEGVGDIAHGLASSGEDLGDDGRHLVEDVLQGVGDGIDGKADVL